MDELREIPRAPDITRNRVTVALGRIASSLNIQPFFERGHKIDSREECSNPSRDHLRSVRHILQKEFEIGTDQPNHPA
jgi:hypothetical protein